MGSAASNFTSAQNSFSSKSTAEDVTANIDLQGKTILITGATAGIGKETARVLAKRGGHIIIGVRNIQKGEAVKEEILKETPSAPFDVLELDVSSLASVRKFAEDFKSRDFPISILINNAGAIFGKFELSQDGLEKNFATNHMGQFLLTNLLLETIVATAEKSGEEGRIVNLTSDSHKLVGKKGIPYDKLNDAKSFHPFTAYPVSKLANILHANELARRLQERGVNVTANSVHPGIVHSNFLQDTSIPFISWVIPLVSLLAKNNSQGAATTCYVTTSPDLKGISGKYFHDSKESKVTKPAQNMDMAAALWKFSEDFVSTH
ncbi:hypothetical protein BDL97_14G079100 [Sphagnum fallax]|nr:hypothetical protein BDL97_14G079100 [Sphagnum fallax]